MYIIMYKYNAFKITSKESFKNKTRNSPKSELRVCSPEQNRTAI